MSTTEPPVGWGPPPGVPPDRTPPPSDGVPAPGELGLKEKRAWKTWQVLVAMAFALVLGLLINNHSGSASGSSANTGSYTPPPPAGSAGSTTTTAAAGATTTSGAGGVTTTTSPASATTTTDAGASSTSSTAAPAQASVLLGPTQREGDWTSTPFTITAAGWNIGWAYQCAAAPASFQVFVAPVGTTSTSTLSPVVSETAMSGQAVTSQSSLGQQILFVNAPANCAWAIKVTGS